MKWVSMSPSIALVRVSRTMPSISGQIPWKQSLANDYSGTPVKSEKKTRQKAKSTRMFLCTLAYYLRWHLKQRLEPLFAADGTHKDRQWTVRNVIERLAAIRRDKIVMGRLGVRESHHA